MKKNSLLLFSFLFAITIHGQLRFAVNDNFYDPDFRILIGENVNLADLEIQFGTNVPFKNFTVGITEFASKADFVITNRSNTDFTVVANSVVSQPDFVLHVDEKMAFPDLAIELRETGSVDYWIYSEIGDLSNTEILMALLPVIHQKTKFKFKRLGEIFFENDLYIQNTSCNDIADFIKKHGRKKGRLNEKKLQSSWLQNVVAYEFKSTYYVLADIKEMSEDDMAPMLQVFTTDSFTWRKFLNDKNSDYEGRFRNLIYGSPCGCK